MKFQKYIVCGIIAFLSFPEFLIGGHPLKSDDSFTVGYRALQIEFTPEFNFGKNFRIRNYPITLTYGLTDKLDLVLSVPYVSEESLSPVKSVSSFFDKQSVEFKWNVFSLKNIQLGFKPGIICDFTNHPQRENTNLSSFFIASVENKYGIFHLNAGSISFSLSDIRSETLHLSFAWEKMINHQLNFVGNVILENNSHAFFKKVPVEFLVGSQYSLNEENIIDFGFSYLMDNGQSVISLLLGYTIVWD